MIKYIILALLILVGCGGNGDGKEDSGNVGHDSADGVAPDLGPGDTLPWDSSTEDSPTADTPSPDTKDDTGSDLGSGDADSSSDVSQTGDFRGPCDSDQLVGQFRIGLTKYGSLVSGRVNDSVDFNNVLLKKQSDAECTIYQRKPWFCDPPCDAGLQCSNKGECIESPAPVSVGTVTLTGLSVPVVLEPDAGLNYQKVDFEGDAFVPGSDINLEATGASTDPFSLMGRGIQGLELTTKTWLLSMNQPFTVEWTPANDPEAKILMTLNVDQHGSTPATMYCEVQDSGTYTIPADMITDLLAYGVNGAPSAFIFRHITDSVSTSLGCVELEIYSQVNATIKVE